MSAATTLAPAYLLHRRPYRNSSLILDLFTQEHGRLSVVAKGVKKARLPIFRYCQPFLPLLVSWVGRSDLKTLVDIEAQRPLADASMHARLEGNALISALYLNELLMRLLPPGDPHGDLYHNYQLALRALLQSESSQIEVTLRLFEKALLSELGFGLPLAHDPQGEPWVAEAWYAFLPEHGFEKIDQQTENAAGGRADYCGVCLPGRVLLAMAHDDYAQPETLRYAKKLMRAALQVQLGSKPLKTRQLIYATAPRA